MKYMSFFLVFVCTGFVPVFAQPYALSLSTDGNGGAYESPTGPYEPGTNVIITAEPYSGYHFDYWTGDYSGSENPATITISMDMNITANFAINTYTLDVYYSNGFVSRDPDYIYYNHGTSVTLYPIADGGYHFTGWSGDAVGIDDPLVIYMDGNKTITANFEINMYTLNTSATNGTIDMLPADVSYPHGSMVTLTPVPLDGYRFVEWTGDAMGSDNPYYITMDGDKWVSATFELYADHMVVSTVSGSTNNAPLDSFTVTVQDYFGNTLTSYAEDITISQGYGFDSNTSLTGTCTKMPIDGCATFSTGGGDIIQIDQIINAGGSFTLAVNSGSMPSTESAEFSLGMLPVEISSFIASVEKMATALKWQTVTEANNYGFDVERRKIEGRSEKIEWERVGFVKGSGNSNTGKEYSYTDARLPSGRYEYRLKQVDNDGSYKYSQSVEIEIAAPKEFALEQNYPNPFNPTTTITYDIPNVGTQHAVYPYGVYDILGKEVATLVNETKEAGSYDVTFNASQLASGIYFYRIQTGSFTAVKKLILMK